MPNKKRKTNNSVKLSSDIMSHVIAQRLRHGDKLPTEQEMAEMFGVSRASIREAICYLAATGHVETRHGKGTFMLHDSNNIELTNINEILDACSFADLMELRVILETWGARLAAQRATPEQISSIESAIEITEASTEEEYFEQDLGFHLNVAIASNNQLIVTIVKLLFKELERQSHKVRVLTWLTRESTTALMKKTLAAIKEQNSKDAGKYMERHLKEMDRLVARNNLKL